MPPEKDIESIVQLLREMVPDLAAIYLFGSRSEGNSGHGSDWDLAILPGKPMKPEAVWNAGQRLSLLLKADVDLVDLLVCDTVLRNQVVHKGKVIFQKSKTAVDEFETQTMSRYAYLNEERKEILAAIRQTGRIHG